MSVLLTACIGLLLTSPLEIPAPAAPIVGGSRTWTGQRPVNVARRGRRRRRPAARCRDIFCTAQVVRLDGKGARKRLSQKQINKVMTPHLRGLEFCLVHERRRDPHLRTAAIDFVISNRGRVLATRVNMKRRTSMARCMHRKLRKVRFPRTGVRRTVASIRLGMTRSR